MRSNLWEPIRDYIDKLNTRGSMPAVHHYTSVSGALGILESGRIWFTERTHLNDPSEVSHGVAIAESVLKGQGGQKEAKDLAAHAYDVFRNFRFFSASFSLEGDDLSQWRNYADDGRGIVLSFKASAFDNPKAHIDKFISDDPTVIVCPMSYNSADLQSVIDSIIRAWNGTDIAELCDHVLMISSMFKADCWKPEKEYRFFAHDRRQKILKAVPYKSRERNGEVVSYLDIPVQNWEVGDNFPIYRIRVGPAAAVNLDVQLADFLFSKGIPVSPGAIVRSTLPYRSFRTI